MLRNPFKINEGHARPGACLGGGWKYWSICAIPGSPRLENQLHLPEIQEACLRPPKNEAWFITNSLGKLRCWVGGQLCWGLEGGNVILWNVRVLELFSIKFKRELLCMDWLCCTQARIWKQCCMFIYFFLLNKQRKDGKHAAVGLVGLLVTIWIRRW